MSTPTYNKFSSIAIGGSNINKVPTTSYGNVSLSVTGKSYHSDASYFDGDISLVGNLNVGSTIISAVELSYIDGLTSNVQTQINNKTICRISNQIIMFSLEPIHLTLAYQHPH